MSTSSTPPPKKSKIAGHVADGTPPLVALGDVQTMIFDIHDFKNRSEEHGKCFHTPAISCHGYKWDLQVNPRGHKDAGTDPEYVSVYLCWHKNEDGTEVTVNYSIGCKNFQKRTEKDTITKSGRGWHEWMTRDQCIAEFLDSDGTLTIKVDLDLYAPKKKVWYPTILHDISLWSEYFDDKTDADAVFLVDGSEFELHKWTIKKQAPILYEMVAEFTGEGPIPITGMDYDTFSIIEKYVYTTLDVSNSDIWKDMKTTKSIFVAADRFGCVSLKLYAESVLTDKFLTSDTCGELLSLADSYSSPLLKETCQEVYKKDSSTVLQSTGWKTMAAKSPDLLLEMMESVSLGSICVNLKDEGTWDVTTLRTKLLDAKLDIDGTKQMLFKRWKDHTSVQGEDN